MQDLVKPSIGRHDLEPKKKLWDIIAICYVVAYFLFLTYKLGYYTLSWDEGTRAHATSILFLNAHTLFTDPVGYFTYYVDQYPFYPPLYSMMAALSSIPLGLNTFAIRLPGAIFGALTLFATYKFGKLLYNDRIGFISTVILSSYPFFYVSSHGAGLDTPVTFFVVMTLFCLYKALGKARWSSYVSVGLMLGLGLLTKYTIITLVLPMTIILLLLMKKVHLETRRGLKIMTMDLDTLKGLIIMILVAIACIAPWAYEALIVRDQLKEWLGASQIQTVPFTLPEIVEYYIPFSLLQLMTPLLALLAIFGLGYAFYVLKRKSLVLISWIIIVDLVFSLLPNKNWRYVVPFLPTFAILTSILIWSLWEKSCKITNINIKTSLKVAIVCVVVLAITSGFAAAPYYMNREFTYIPLDQGCQSVAQHIQPGRNVMLVLQSNLMNVYSVSFYLAAYQPNILTEVLVYPSEPVEMQLPQSFNVTALRQDCLQHNVDYLFLYEGAWTSVKEITLEQVLNLLLANGFTPSAIYGDSPNRVFMFLCREAA